MRRTFEGWTPKTFLPTAAMPTTTQLRSYGETTNRLATLDDLIGRHSVGWSLERMSPVDRNVLRVAVLELLEADVPRAAVIDEAVEIAKRFSGDEAGRFVNGVLGAVLQELGGVAGGGAGGTGGTGGEGSDGGAVSGGVSGGEGSDGGAGSTGERAA